MIIRVREYRFIIDNLKNKREDILVKEDFFDTYPHRINFLGTREEYSYDNLINIIKVEDNRILVEMFSENLYSVQRKYIELNKEEYFQEKYPNDMLRGYYYSISLLEGVKNHED